MNNNLTAYVFQIKIGRRMIQWERFSTDRNAAVESASKALREEYPDKKHMIIGVREMTETETNDMRNRGIMPTF
jgi:hypothetical protein